MAIATIVRITVLVSALMASSSLASAQDIPPLGGPRMGLVLDKTHGLRPINGISGAATIGTSILAPRRINAVVMAPQGGYALAIAAPNQRLMLLRIQGASYSPVELNFPTGASRMVLSPSGTSAAVYYGNEHSVAVITGLPDSASLLWRLDLPDFAGAIAALAVSDDGSAVLAAAESTDSALFVMSPDLNYRLLHHISGSPSVAFLINSLDAVVADGALDRIMLMRNIKGDDPQITEIGGKTEGVSAPVAVAVSADNRKVYVANKNPGGVLSLNLSGGEADFTSCNCTPTLMEPLGGDTIFRLNEAGQGPIWLFDAGRSPQRIVFVPDQSRQLPVRSRPPIR